MYCDDSSVKPVDSKQVVVRNFSSFFPPFFFSNTIVEPKGIRFVLQKSSTLDLSSNLLFGPLLVVTYHLYFTLHCLRWIPGYVVYN